MRLDLNEPREPKDRPPALWNEEVWRWASLVVAWGLGAFSIALALRGWGTGWFWVDLAWMGLGAACATSGLTRVLLLDLFAQFHYREKFALFLAHVVVLVAPIGVMGKGWLLTGLVVVTISVSIQLVQAVSFHRYLALCACLAVIGFWSRPPGAIGLAVGWCFLAGVFLLVERIRFSLEDLRGPSPSVSPHHAAQMAVVFVLLPLLVAGSAAWLFPPPAAPAPAAVARFQPGLLGQRGHAGGESVQHIMWEALGLAVAIAVLIALLYWYSGMQMRKKGKQPELKELLVAAESESVGPPLPRPRLDPLESRESRFEIFRQFRRLERALARLDLARKGSWTAREYLRRVFSTEGERSDRKSAPTATAPHVSAVAPTPSIPAPEPEPSGEERTTGETPLVQTYEKARYADENPTAQEVNGFRKEVGRIIDEARKHTREQPSKGVNGAGEKNGTETGE